MEDDKSFSEAAGNWLRGALVRAYTAQRDHFLELYARKAPARGRPVNEERDAIRREPRPRSIER